ncbi:NACHT domain-containing protein [Actinomadura sp. 9N215]|uniref:NACHT domain-containing protein n=1 Tax=Actinomadura sp. 9N215 TaxID=3375150 RepID=UPI00378DBD5A
MDALRLVAGGFLILGLSLGVTAWTSAAVFSEGEAFNRNVGIANILGACFGALGLAGLVFGWLTRSMVLPTAVIEEARAGLATKVKEQEVLNRKLILGPQRAVPARPPLSNGAGLETRSWRSLISFRRSQRTPHDLSTIGDFYEELNTQRLLITGAPGAGKTVLLIELALQLLERNQGEGAPVPVRISMAGWRAENVSVKEWIADRIARDYSIAPRIVRKFMERGAVLPLLDGLDEMERDPEHPASAKRAVERLNDYHAEMRRSVITCRDEEFSDLRKDNLEFPGTVSIQVLPLDVDRIEEYVKAAFPEGDMLSAWQEKIAHMRRHPDGPIARVLGAPLWLFLATRGRQGLDLLDEAVPVERTKGRLLNGFIAEAVGRNGRYSEPEVRRWLQELARLLHRQAVAGGSGTDIVPYRLWRAIGRVSTVLGLGAGVVITMGGRLAASSPLELTLGILDGLVLCSVLVVLCQPPTVGPPIRSFFAGSAGAEPPFRESLRSMLRSYSTIWAPYRRALLITLFLMAAMTGFGGVAQGSDWDGALRHTLARVTVIPLIVVVARYVMRDVRESYEAKFELHSHSKKRITLRTWTPLLALIPIVFVIAISGTKEEEASLNHVGPFFRDADNWTLILVLFLVLSAVFLCNVYALAYEAARGQLPLRFGRFLDWGVEVGLLRLSGTAYQFRHIELQRLCSPEAPRSRNLQPVGECPAFGVTRSCAF